jgi:hypothetical protein
MRRHRTLRQLQILLALALALALFAGCAATPLRDTDRIIDDATIQAKLEAHLKDDPRLGANQVDLEVRRGVVTLVGWVGSDNERRAIEDAAWAVLGVRQVENRLQLRDPDAEGPGGSS